MLSKNTVYLTIISIILGLITPLVAICCRKGESETRVLCRAVPTERIVRGEDEPGKLRLFLVPGDRVDINRATERELELLPGIGEVLAERIVEYRRVNGPFGTPEELMEVEGIDRGRFEELAPWIYAGDTT